MSNSFVNFILKDIIWAAGFWEGEGSCGVYANSGNPDKYKSLRVSACQTDIGPINKLIGCFGGICSEYHKDDSSKGIFTWQINGTRAYFFLKAILPYVQSTYKQKQINSTLNQWEVYKTSLGKTKYITKRVRKTSIVYEVRLNIKGKTEFIGSFKDPELAYLCLMTKLREAS